MAAETLGRDLDQESWPVWGISAVASPFCYATQTQYFSQAGQHQQGLDESLPCFEYCMFPWAMSL